MSDQGAGHEEFDQLAAGHVLHGLEPADEQCFLQHAGECPRCRELVADFGEVAELLAQATEAGEPSEGLGQRILGAARADSGRRDLGPRVPQEPDASTNGRSAERPGASFRRWLVPPRHRRAQRWPKVAAVAAAAAVVAGGGIWAGLAATSGHSRSPVAACAQAHACRQVVLLAAGTHRTAAKIIISGAVVWMEPAVLAPNPAGDIYVLWQITGARTPLAVGSFDVARGVTVPIRVGGLPAPYAGTRAFAVSLEHGRTIPAAPSRPVALGQVP